MVIFADQIYSKQNKAQKVFRLNPNWLIKKCSFKLSKEIVEHFP